MPHDPNKRWTDKASRLSVSLSPEERARLSAIAAIEKRSDSYIAAEAIRYWLQVQAASNPALGGQTRLDLQVPSN